MTEKTNADSLGAALLDRNDGLQTSDQTELPFMCLTYGMEEAAKHPIPGGKFAKVACVHKSVPRIIEQSRLGPASCSLSARALSPSAWPIHNEAIAKQHTPHPEPI
jgi:hypothetical protein